ncbi:type II secretion system protein [Anaerostipes sp.]|uniref:type II secretion system protein n=1 Tax=Anaerostipes sp. TaxID=1872530 RepID=UPI0025B7F23C|nr:type II secretion system protein [Anaerostipes sp.]MBS7009301.1 type II secretion system protein [Anaerostipes sp.]
MKRQLKKRRLCRKLVQAKAGMTLVELIVTFLLLGILMTAAIATLAPAMNVMGRISNMSRAQSVADILMEKICGEVGSAAGQVQMDSGNEKISYADKKGRMVIMYAKEETDGKKLVLHYQASSISEGGEAAKKGVDWTFSKKMYMNQEIKELKFEREKDTNLVKIILTVRNVKTGQTYKRTKIVECYKLDESGFITDKDFPDEL